MPRMSQSKDSVRTKTTHKPVQSTGPADKPAAPVEPATTAVDPKAVDLKKKKDDAMAKANAYASGANADLAKAGSEYRISVMFNHGRPQYHIVRDTVVENDVSDDRLKELVK